MALPTGFDYSQAIQYPSLCFQDPVLKRGRPKTNRNELPTVISGNFASVFPIKCGSKTFAVRCFTKNIADQKKRYEKIDAYLQEVKLPYFVGFNYLDKGILVKGEWYPILKMEWCEGKTLNKYLFDIKQNPHSILKLAEDFLSMADVLYEHSIAHGDLQHGNILIVDSNIKLVDYDGMYIPPLEGFSSTEGGHSNYQHPERKGHFNKELDKFSVWVIYTSLRALGVDESLRNQLKADAERLLFAKNDFLNPHASTTFEMLAVHADAQVRQFSAAIKGFLGQDIARIPSLMAHGSPPSAGQKRTGTSGDWIRDHIAGQTREKQAESWYSNADWISQLSAIPNPTGRSSLATSTNHPSEKPSLTPSHRVNNPSRPPSASRSVESKAPTGSVSITSKPSGAEIRLDGRYMGEAYLDITKVPAGPHTITFTLPNHETLEQNFTLQPGERLRIQKDLTWKLITGTIEVESNPRGAQVYLDGVLKGPSPIIIPSVPSGIHKIELLYQDYRPYESTIRLHPEQKLSITPTLNRLRKVGILEVTSPPFGALVSLDGIPKGTTPLTLHNIAAGTHIVAISYQHYETLEKRVEIIPDRRNRFSQRLVRKTSA